MPLCCSLSDHPGGGQWRGEDVSAGPVRPGKVHPRLLLGHRGHRIHSKHSPPLGTWCGSARAPAGNGWTLPLHHSRGFNKDRLPRCKQGVGKPGGVTQWPWGVAGPPSHAWLKEVRGGNDLQPQRQRGLCGEAWLAGAATGGGGTQQHLVALPGGARAASLPPTLLSSCSPISFRGTPRAEHS